MTNLDKYAYLYLANLEICEQVTDFSAHVKIVRAMFEEMEDDPATNPPESFKRALYDILSVDMMRDISDTLKPVHDSPWGQYAVTRAYCAATIFDLARDFDDGSLELEILSSDSWDDWTDYNRNWALSNTASQFRPLYVKVDYIIYSATEKVKTLIENEKSCHTTDLHIYITL